MDQQPPAVPRPPLERLIDLLRRACALVPFRDRMLRFLRACWAGRDEEAEAAKKEAAAARKAAAAARRRSKKKHKKEADRAHKEAAAAAQEAAKKAARKDARAAAKKAASLDTADKSTSSPQDRTSKDDEAGKIAAAQAAKNVAASTRAPRDHARDAGHDIGVRARAAKQKDGAAPPCPSATTSASPAPAGPSCSTSTPEPAEEEEIAHLMYWEVHRQLKNRKVTPCMVCYLEPESKVRKIDNDEREIKRHVDRYHKGGVQRCRKDGCFVIGKDGRQIGMHQYLAHHIS